MSPDTAPEPPFRVIETVTRGGTTFELLEYRALSGSEPLAAVERLYALNRAGARLRQLRVRLADDAVRAEPGALQFLKGHVQMESPVPALPTLTAVPRQTRSGSKTGTTAGRTG